MPSRTFDTEVWTDLPVEQDQARVRVRGAEPGVPQACPNDMRDEERWDGQSEEELENFPGWEAKVPALVQ